MRKKNKVATLIIPDSKIYDKVPYEDRVALTQDKTNRLMEQNKEYTKRPTHMAT